MIKYAQCGTCNKILNAEEKDAYEIFKEMCPDSSQKCLCVKCITEDSETELLIDSK